MLYLLPKRKEKITIIITTVAISKFKISCEHPISPDILFTTKVQMPIKW
jgi:hypothetical protein